MAVIEAFPGAPAGDTEAGDGDRMGGPAQGHLKSFVDRLERLEEDKAAVTADMKEVYAEAKAMGFDTKILRKVISLRKMDQNDRAEQDALLELYLAALDGG